MINPFKMINGVKSTIISKLLPSLQTFGRILLVHLLTILFGLISVILLLIRPGKTIRQNDKMYIWTNNQPDNLLGQERMIKDWVSPQRPTETADLGNHSSAKVKVSR